MASETPADNGNGTVNSSAAPLKTPLPYEQANFIRYALDCAAIVAITDVQGTITFVNDKFCEISGYSAEELIGANHRILQSGAHDRDFFRAMYRDIAQGRVWHGEICNKKRDGSIYWVDTTIVPHMSAARKIESYTSIRFDITPRKQAEEALRMNNQFLREIIHLDPLTNLPNSRRLHEVVEQRVESKSGFTLAVLDIDSFREVNEVFGRDAGESFLKAIAARLAKLKETYPDFFVARLDGDKFGLISSDLPQNQGPLFEAVHDLVRRPVDIGVSSYRSSASIGISAFPSDGSDAVTLFKMADIALLHAKASGRDRSEVFRPELKEKTERRSAVLQEIAAAIESGEFHLHYQPIVPVSMDSAISLEALMRWHHPTLGVQAPAFFSAGFEDAPTRAILGMFMLERAFRDLRAAMDGGLAVQRLAINLTTSDINSETFVSRFFELLGETSIPPAKLCVEVTEGVFLGSDQRQTLENLRRFHRAGVEVALDDFGTGFASLTHLRRFPIDRLKIDRSFITNVLSSVEDQVIVSGIINIAHGLGKHVTAEGVETAEQVRYLQAQGCDSLQGWYFSRAQEMDELAKRIERIPRL